mmetsp:Transcript_1508/g.5152  ORF Transcript_1508/g.5152 Transcript_1508/m.5152 type:complete len:142 (+) Transcript_1508:258-683(+)
MLIPTGQSNLRFQAMDQIVLQEAFSKMVSNCDCNMFRQKKFLHSHRHRSPLSGQQEVSCLEPLNTGDDWIVILDSNDRSGVWNQGEKFRLMHADTQMYLHSHKHTFGNPIPGQQEVTGFPTKGDSQNVWTAEEGIYLTSEE